MAEENAAKKLKTAGPLIGTHKYVTSFQDYFHGYSEADVKANRTVKWPFPR